MSQILYLQRKSGFKRRPNFTREQEHKILELSIRLLTTQHPISKRRLHYLIVSDGSLSDFYYNDDSSYNKLGKLTTDAMREYRGWELAGGMPPGPADTF